MGGSLVDLQEKVNTMEFDVSGLQGQIDELKTGADGGTVGNSSSAEVAKRLKTSRNLWGQPFDGTVDIKGSIYVETSPYTLRLGKIIIQANESGTELSIKNVTSTTKVALKVSGNVIGYV